MGKITSLSFMSQQVRGGAEYLTAQEKVLGP